METGFEDPNKVKPENESSAETDLNTAKLTKAMANHSINDSKLNTDLPDFEYDEDMNSLVAEEYEFKEDESDLITIEDAKIGAGQLTSDNLIDEDFEAELGGANSFLQSNLTDTTEQETDKATAELKEHIARYDIVNVCGSDLTGRHIIVLSACNLPDNETLQKDILFKSHQHFFDTLLEVLVGILERYVESEYTLVYFHYGLKSTSQPSFNWLAKVYRMLDRKFKKNLKALYVVHPSMLFKILWQFIRPLISSKFNKKVTYCRTLAELAAFIDLSILKIPEDVKLYDHQLKPRKSVLEDQAKIKAEEKHGPYQQFKVSLEQIASNNKGDPIPLCVKETIIYLRKHLDEEGLFRKSGALDRIKQIQYLYNYGEPVAYDQYEFHVAACVLKAFVRELPESLLNESIFNEMMSLQALDVVDKVEVTRDLLSAKLPKHNYTVLNYLIEFLNEVTQHSAQNKMDARNLSYVFGPNFLRKNDDPEYGLMDIEKLNNFVELLIKYHSDIFISNVIKD